MLEAIQKFSDSEVFSVTLENEPEKTKHWFRATDLCDVLFSKNNSHKYVTTHCKDWQYREFQVGNGRPALYVCESGVYRLILRSKAPIAIEFQDWLTEDVLPKLRASGGYIMPSATSEQLEALQSELTEKVNRIKELHQEKEIITKELAFAGECCDYPTLLELFDQKYNFVKFNKSNFVEWLGKKESVYIRFLNPDDQGTTYLPWNKEYMLNKTLHLKNWLLDYFIEIGSKRDYNKLAADERKQIKNRYKMKECYEPGWNPEIDYPAYGQYLRQGV
jgi:prophage antirepressor-like protein